MPNGRVEAPPVVADLQDDLALLSLDANVRRARPGMLLDIRERFAPDGEQLAFSELGQSELRPRSLDVDGHPFRSAQVGGLPGQRRNQPVLDRLAMQLEDQRAHLAL